MDTYSRKVQVSVTVFPFYRNCYLFLKRGLHKKVDPGKLNGIGGRLEPGEDYLSAAIRETKEETGYEITPSQVSLAGVVRLENLYKVDWIMCFFKIKVQSKKIPLGNKTEDGELIWIDKNKVLDNNHNLVDDLNYCFKEIIEGKELFFISAHIDRKFKIDKISKEKLRL